MEEQKVASSHEAITYLRDIHFPISACWEELARDLVVPLDVIDKARISWGVHNRDFAGALEDCVDWLIRNDDRFSFEILKKNARRIKKSRSEGGDHSDKLFNLDRAILFLFEAKVDVSNFKWLLKLHVPMSEIMDHQKEYPKNINGEVWYKCLEYWNEKVPGDKSWDAIANVLDKSDKQRFKRAVRKKSSLCSEDTAMPPEAPDIIENNFMTMCSGITNPLTYAVELYEEYLLTKGEFQECISQFIPYVDKLPSLRLVLLLNVVYQSAGRCAVNQKKPPQDAISYFIRMLTEDGVKCAGELKQQYEKMLQQFEKELETTKAQANNQQPDQEVSFTDLVHRAAERVVQSVPLEELQEFLIAESHEADQLEIQSLQSLNDIRQYLIKEAIRSESVAKLERITAHFKFKIGRDAYKELTDYIKRKSYLSEKTKLKDLAKVEKKTLVKTKDSQIIFKVSWDVDKATVQKFEDFLNDAFEKLASYITILGVKQSIITVFCTIPQWLSRAFRRMVRDLGDAYFDNKGVVEVTLNDEILFCQYPETTSTSLLAVSTSGDHHERPPTVQAKQSSMEEDVFHSESSKQSQISFTDSVHKAAERVIQSVPLEKLKEFLVAESHQADQLEIQSLQSLNDIKEYLIKEAIRSESIAKLERITAHFKIASLPAVSTSGDHHERPPTVPAKQSSEEEDVFYSGSGKRRRVSEEELIPAHHHMSEHEKRLMELISQLQTHVSQLKTELVEKDQVIGKHFKTNMESRKENEQLKKQIEELKADNSKLKKQIRTTTIDVPEASEDSNRIYSPPVKLRLRNFSSYLDSSRSWYSSPFYTHFNGYKMCLRVVPSGLGEGQGKYVSVYAHLMKGDHDDTLPWPFVGSIQLNLLNQIDDIRLSPPQMLNFDAEGMDPDANSRVIAGKLIDSGMVSNTGHGSSKAIRRTDLEYSSSNDTQYLKDDTIVIQVTNVMVQSTNVALTQLPWEAGKPSKTVKLTMPNFNEYKKSGNKWLSKPFESHSKGYQFILMVFANGLNDKEGKSVSVYVHLTKGEHDDKLSFPFTGKVCVRLLNSIEDDNHIQREVEFSDKTEDMRAAGMAPTSGYNEVGLGFDDFLEHDRLDFNSSTNTQYLDNDSLNFTIPWVKLN